MPDARDLRRSTAALPARTAAQRTRAAAAGRRAGRPARRAPHAHGRPGRGGRGDRGFFRAPVGRGYAADGFSRAVRVRSEEHTSELPSLMLISYAVFCLKKKKKKTQ